MPESSISATFAPARNRFLHVREDPVYGAALRESAATHFQKRAAYASTGPLEAGSMADTVSRINDG